MSEHEEMSEHSDVILARLEGKIDNIREAGKRTEEDIRSIREKQDAQGAVIAALSGLNIQDRLTGFAARFEKIDAAVRALENRHNTSDGERRGVENTVKLLWTILGAVGASIAALVARQLGI